jgi:DNA-binding CsgD family transcriptional regulator
MRSRDGVASQDNGTDTGDTGEIDVTALAAVLRGMLAEGRKPLPPQDPAVRHLMFLGLLRATAAGFEAVDLHAARQLLAHSVIDELVERATFYARVAAVLDAVPEDEGSAAPEPGAEAGEGGGITYVHGIAEISKSVNAEVTRATTEVITAQPGGGRTSETLDSVVKLTLDVLARGVRMRTIYQHSSRFDEPTKEYVRRITEAGAQIRTLDEFFDRLIIVDKRIAFIPSVRDRTSALKVTEPGLVHFLIDLFDRNWLRAAPYSFVPTHAASAVRDVGPSIRNAIVKMLVDGMQDKTIAKRLGISLRTIQGHVAAIRAEYNASNRTQLGYLLALEVNRMNEEQVSEDCAIGEDRAPEASA